MHISVCLLAVMLTLPLQYGCGLQKVVATPVPQAQASLPAQVQGKRIAVSMNAQAARIKGGHHEGLLQARQPWIFGLSSEQRHLLYDHAAEVAALAFSHELQHQGLVVNPEGAAFTLAGTLEVVTLHTYGHGSKEGFGTAGNYWEAKVEFADLQLTETGTGRVLWRGGQEGYARLSPCPATMDWGMLTVLAKTLQSTMILVKMQTSLNPMGFKQLADTLDGAYSVAEIQATPIDLAARVAAVDMLAKVAWPQGQP